MTQLNENISSTLILMERAALDRWGQGDPGGFLEISASDVVYFDPYIDKRIDGLEALTRRYQEIWGKVHLDRFELLNPFVQVCGSVAVLTFNYVSWSGQNETRWNCTEVFRHEADRWLIIQTHWSYTGHGRNKKQDT